MQPTIRGRRAEALPKHNLGTSKYSTAFWAPIAAEYGQLQP